MLKINLLPPEKRKKLKKVKPTKKKAALGLKLKLEFKFDPYMVFPAAAAILAVVLIVGSFFWLGYQEKTIKGQRNKMQVELNMLGQINQRIDNLKAQTLNVKNRMEVILKVDQNRFLWPRILDELSTAMPQYSWLESISEVEPFPQLVLRIEGTTMSNLLLSRLLENLENCKILTDIKLISSTEKIYGSNLNTSYFVVECACALNEPVDSTKVVAKK
ncbi:MAG TPA: PilN domain-containing protein [archaeon]|nr:PilN domain-containing protein [archaeon]